MELRHLRYFMAVAEVGSVSRAADLVRVSQPALSRQIHDLEGELGVRLFARAGRRLHLTGPGEDLVAYGRKVLNEAAAFRERARILNGGDTGVLRVGATPQSLQRLFPPVLSRFRQALPGVDVRLIEGTSAGLLELIRKGEVHLGLTTYEPELREGSRLVGVLPIFAISKGERRDQEDRIEVRALEDVPLLLLRPGFGGRDLFDAACQMAHIRPNIFLESGAPSTLLALAKADCGIAILPATVSLRDPGIAVRKLLQDGAPLEVRIAVHWNPQSFLPPYADRFAAELAAYAVKEFADAAAAAEGDKARTRRPRARTLPFPL